MPHRRPAIVWTSDDPPWLGICAPPGSHLNIKTVFPGIWIPVYIRRSVFVMGIPILVRWRLYTEMVIGLVELSVTNSRADFLTDEIAVSLTSSKLPSMCAINDLMIAMQNLWFFLAKQWLHCCISLNVNIYSRPWIQLSLQLPFSFLLLILNLACAKNRIPSSAVITRSNIT